MIRILFGGYRGSGISTFPRAHSSVWCWRLSPTHPTLFSAQANWKAGQIPAPLSGSSDEVIPIEGLCQLKSADGSKGARSTADTDQKHPGLRYDRKRGSDETDLNKLLPTPHPTLLSQQRKTDPLPKPLPNWPSSPKILPFLLLCLQHILIISTGLGENKGVKFSLSPFLAVGWTETTESQSQKKILEMMWSTLRPLPKWEFRDCRKSFQELPCTRGHTPLLWDRQVFCPFNNPEAGCVSPEPGRTGDTPDFQSSPCPTIHLSPTTLRDL